MSPRFEAICPKCGGVVKRSVATGRYDYHGWANGCDFTMPGPEEEPPEGRQSPDEQPTRAQPTHERPSRG